MTNRLVEGLDNCGVVGVALLVSLSILGCGSDAPVGMTRVAPTPVATTLTLSATVLTFSSLGETEQLTATVRDQNGATMSGASVAWASSPSSVASVSSTGLVAAVADGAATVTATSGSATGNASVTVQQVAASVTLSPSSLVLAGPGATATVTASVLDAGGSEIASPDLTWSSSDESIATVNSSGLVTAVASGSATITVTSGGPTVTQALSITVEEGSLVDPAGGVVSLANDAVNLVFPAGAVSEAVFITAESATGLPAQPVPIPSTAFDFGPDGIVFAEPVTLTIEYDPANVPLGVPEEELRLHKLVGSGYVQMDAGVVDVVNHTVSGAIDGFSVFVILRLPPPVITTTSPMPTGTVGLAYGQTLAAAGGDGSYTWALINGTTLPAGLALNTATGLISGTPSATGTTDFEVEVTTIGLTATKALQITITNAPLVVTTTSLPDGNQGVAYSQTLSATGGDASYSWSVTVDSLPTGLSLNPSTGQISGTPTVAETRNFTVQVTSGDGQTASQTLSITIQGPPLVISTTPPLPDGTVGVAYSHTLTATGGDGDYTWSVAGGSLRLPTGLSLNSATGEISGAPTTAERRPFAINVVSNGQFASQGFSITVRGDLQAGDIVFGDGSANVSRDLTQGAIFKKNLATGALAPIAAAELTEGIRDLSYDRNRGVIFGVANPFASGVRVIRVEPLTGAQTIVSQGGFLQNGVSGITVGLDGQLYVTSVETSGFGIQERLFRIDPVTGVQESLTRPNEPMDIVTAADGLIYIGARGFEIRDGTNFLVGAILEYDPVSGLTREVSVGGLLFPRINVIAIHPDGSLLSAVGASIIRIDLATGDQSLLVTPIPIHHSIWGMAVQQDGTILVLNGNAKWIVRVDPVTLAAEVIPSGSPRLEFPRGLMVIPNR